MKKRYAVGFMSILLVSLLTGCGSGKNYVTLGEYKGIEASRVVYDVSDDEIAAAVEEAMYDYVTYDEVTDRAAKDGDNVNVDYVLVTLDGKPYVAEPDDEDADAEDDGQDADDSDEEYEDEEDYDEDPYSGYDEDIVIGEEYVYPEVEKALIGMKKGETKTVSATFTEDYVDEDMVGRKAEFEVTLNEIWEENLPEYNDAFVQENLGFDTIAEYEESVKQQLLSDKEDEYKYDSVAEILEKVIAGSTFSGYPKELYQECEEEYDANNEYMAAMYGMELSEYEELVGLDADTKKQEIEDMVHERQVIEAIAKAEGIKKTDDDVKKLANELYEDYKYDSVDEFIYDYGMDYLKYYLSYEDVSDVLYDNARFTEISEEEYNARLEAEYEDDGEYIELEDEEE